MNKHKIIIFFILSFLIFKVYCQKKTIRYSIYIQNNDDNNNNCSIKKKIFASLILLLIMKHIDILQFDSQITINEF